MSLPLTPPPSPSPQLASATLLTSNTGSAGLELRPSTTARISVPPCGRRRKTPPGRRSLKAEVATAAGPPPPLTSPRARLCITQNWSEASGRPAE
eukprot:scaffold134716_cov31-Tisochrysis_lutea.AAC.5